MHSHTVLWLFELTGLLGDMLAQATPTVSPTPGSTPESATIVGLPAIVMVRGLTLGAVAFLIGMVVGRPVINWLRDRGIGKHIRIEGPPSHQVKTGTPTMGGLIFLIPLVVVIGIFMDIVQFQSLLLPLGIVISCGIFGGFDDLLSTAGRNRGGLKGRFKIAWLLVIGTITSIVVYAPFPWGLERRQLFVPFSSESPDLGIWFIPLAVIAFVGTANAVNFTDGLDSLAGGTSAIAFISYGVIAFLSGQIPVVLLCFAIVGALLAFLWFNAHPAQVIMGDAGSLTLGALLATCALMTNQLLLLPLIGIVFVAETVAVILQVLYFKLTGGKRLFKMAPLHHHFEMLGWSETQVTMRFWLISMIAGMLGIALALA